MTLGPRVMISPSEAMRTSTSGIGRPTVPSFVRPKVLTAITGEVSVSP